MKSGRYKSRNMRDIYHQNSAHFVGNQQGVIDNAQALCKGLLARDVKIVSGGTDNHLMLVDLTNYDLTGKAVEKLLDKANRPD